MSDLEPRIAPLRAPDAADGLLARMPVTPSGTPMNLFATLAHAPQLLRGVGVLGAAVTTRSGLPVADRELAILRTAATLGCAYELGHHRVLAVEAGIDPAHVEAVIVRGSLDWADERQRVVVACADELLATNALGDPAWEALAPFYDEPQRMELLALVGFYRFLAGLLDGLRIAPEDDPGLRTVLSFS